MKQRFSHLTEIEQENEYLKRLNPLKNERLTNSNSCQTDD